MLDANIYKQPTLEQEQILAKELTNDGVVFQLHVDDTKEHTVSFFNSLQNKVSFQLDFKIFVQKNKNGNIHIKFNQNFMNKINVIYGKLKGWISNPQDAKNEMDISIKEAVEHFNYDVPRIGRDLLILDNKEQE